jgi:hypothetical protein
MLSLTSLTVLLSRHPMARRHVVSRARAMAGTVKQVSPVCALSLATLSPAEREWFRVYKWERPASPATMQHMMARTFGARRAEELVVFFEKTAIPARPGEWRRRMH